jgi:hypothetical protein
MWTSKYLVAVVAMGLLIAGCVPSLNPVYRASDLVFDESIVGVWTQDGARWDFKPRDAKSYHLVYSDKDGRQGKFIAHLANLDGDLFLDLFPEDSSAEDTGFYKFHLVPIHTIYRVKSTSPPLVLAAIDYKWLEAELDKRPQALPSSTFDGRRLITGSTDEVRAFVIKNKDRFTGDFRLERQADVSP